MFSFEYFSIARFMPFAIREQEYPESMQICDKKLNKIMLALNSVMPALYGLALLIYNFSFDKNSDGS
jgi:hypothetical protein